MYGMDRQSQPIPRAQNAPAQPPHAAAPSPPSYLQHCISCAFRQPVLIYLVCVVIVLLTEFWIFRYLESKFVERAGQSLAATAVNIADKLDLILKERSGDLHILAQDQHFQDLDPAAITTHLRWMVEAYPVYDWIGVTDKTGRIVAASEPTKIGQDRSDRDWFQSVRDHGTLHIRRPQISPDSHGTMAIAFSAPIYNRSGQFIGAVTSRVSVPILEDFFVRTVSALQTQWGTAAHIEYQFLDADGKIIADSMLREEGKVNLVEMGLPSAKLALSSLPGHILEQHLRRGKEVITGYAVSRSPEGQSEAQMGVLVRVDFDDLVAPIRHTSFMIGLAGLAMVLPLGAALVWSLTRINRAAIQAENERERATTAEQKFRHILDSAPDAMIIVNATGTIILANPQADTLFDYPPGGLLNQPLDILLPERFRTRHQKHNQMFFDHPGTRPMGAGMILAARRHDGSEFPTDVSLSSMDTPEGRFAIASIRDVTEQKQREHELEVAKMEALSSTKVKSEFLASMSHEIRTPLNAIIGTADLLWETDLSSEQRKYLRVFRRGGDTLLSLINDILDLSKIESGYMELDAVSFNLEEVIDKVMEMLTMQANDKGLEFASHIDQTVPRDLLGDPVRLTQILVNLLGNALKFTQRGSVTLQVTNDSQTGIPGSIHFAVSDTGIGIPADKLDVIFERFRQVDSSRTRLYGGTGLGLAISKHLAERMHGRIWVESTQGIGSTFHCTATFTVQSPTDAQSIPTVMDLTGIRTLIVDDHSINRLILREMLSDCRADFAEAENGSSAIRAIQEAADQGRPFELLLLDCRMPELDGFQTVDRLKQSSLDKGLTIVMLTSDDWANDIARTYDLSLGGYLIKPLRRADLIKAIGIALRRTQTANQPPQPATPATPTASRALRVLLADDSPDNQLLIRSYLQGTGHTLDVVDNGADAVERFKTTRYDVVLMDMQMPVMDGFTATQTIRQWEADQQQRPIPIIALTALALKEEASRSIRAGCTLHLTKPIRKKSLIDILESPSGSLAA